MHAIPGGPFDNRKEIAASGESKIGAKVSSWWSVWKQYGDYLGGVITGDLGPSFGLWRS